eukprot:816921-Pelagomonas_calceolata.AAC.2
MAATQGDAPAFDDMEGFLRVAKYTLVKNTDMNTEMKEEVGTKCTRFSKLWYQWEKGSNDSLSLVPLKEGNVPHARYVTACRPWISASPQWKSIKMTWKSAPNLHHVFTRHHVSTCACAVPVHQLAACFSWEHSCSDNILRLPRACAWHTWMACNLRHAGQHDALGVQARKVASNPTPHPMKVVGRLGLGKEGPANWQTTISQHRAFLILFKHLDNALCRRMVVNSKTNALTDDQGANGKSIFASHVHAMQMIKEQMDKKFGSPWHVVVGKAFGYEITYEVRNLLYIFVGGRTSVLLWKM